MTRCNVSSNNIFKIFKLLRKNKSKFNNHNSKISECLTIAKNRKATTIVLNNTTITIDFSDTIEVDHFSQKQIKQMDLNNFVG